MTQDKTKHDSNTSVLSKLTDELFKDPKSGDDPECGKPGGKPEKVESAMLEPTEPKAIIPISPKVIIIPEEARTVLSDFCDELKEASENTYDARGGEEVENISHAIRVKFGLI